MDVPRWMRLTRRARRAAGWVVLLLIEFAPASARARTPELPVDEGGVSPDQSTDYGSPATPSDVAVEYVPPSAPELPTIMPSRLSVGARTGYGSPLGSLALTANYYPVSWFGIESAVAPPAFGEPSTLGESALFGWPLASWLEQGLGIGLAQSFVTAPAGSHSGVVSYLTADCGHFTFYFSRAVSFRVSVDISFALSGGSFCEAHPDACPHTTPVSGNGTLFWNFDVGGGGQ